MREPEGTIREDNQTGTRQGQDKRQRAPEHEGESTRQTKHGGEHQTERAGREVEGNLNLKFGGKFKFESTVATT